MKLQKNNLSSNSSKRWKDAQIAEWKTYHNQKDISANEESQFNYESFTISSQLFNDKTILEVGCSPAASIHKINEEYKIGLDPQPYEFARVLFWLHESIYVCRKKKD